MTTPNPETAERLAALEEIASQDSHSPTLYDYMRRVVNTRNYKSGGGYTIELKLECGHFRYRMAKEGIPDTLPCLECLHASHQSQALTPLTAEARELLDLVQSSPDDETLQARCEAICEKLEGQAQG